MDAYGYIIKGRAGKLDPSYFPSLIGIEPAQTEPTLQDVYFERIDGILDQRITFIGYSKWVNFDSLPAADRDPILEIKTHSISYYMPLSELQEEREEMADKTVLSMLEALRRQRVPA